MTTYSAITSGQIDADSYVDTTLVGQLTNNLLAVQEQDSSAPVISGLWKLIGDSGELAASPLSQYVNFTDLDTAGYNTVIAMIEQLIPVTDGAAFRAQVGYGATPTWETGLSYDGGTANYAQFFSSVGNGANEGVRSGFAIISPINSAVYCEFDGDTLHARNTSGVKSAAISANYDGAQAVSAVRFYFSSGNIASGRIRLYGISG